MQLPDEFHTEASALTNKIHVTWPLANVHPVRFAHSLTIEKDEIE